MNKKIDYTMLTLTLALIVVGLISLFTASYALSLSETGDPFRYVTRQSQFAILGFFCMMFISKINYHILSKYAWWIYAIAIILMALVLTPLGVNHGGATRWLNLGFTEFQPSETAKTAVIILFSSLIVKIKGKMKYSIYELVVLFVCLGMILVFTIMQKHLSASAIIAGTAVVIIFIAGYSLKWIISIGTILVICGVGYVASKEYATSRINVWLDPFIDRTGDGFQGSQSFITIGSGGLFGLGFAQGRQKHLFLPEPENDFIFPVICEELGFIGAVAIILLFAMFIYRGFIIGAKAKDQLGTLLAIGIITKFSIQVIMNLFVVTGVIPITGVSLPFFSSGGTALIIQMCEIGILLNISRNSNL